MTIRNHRRARPRAAVAALALGLLPAYGAFAACPFDSGSSGADGAFSPTRDTTVQLPADGILNYTAVNIPSGITVTFTRNARNTPVYLLASGDVNIAGLISVSGQPGCTSDISLPVPPGPGGFEGGFGGLPSINLAPATVGSRGLGPGGSLNNQGGGSSSYLTPELIPLLGGSGSGGSSGGGASAGYGGGGGGGALLIAASGTVTLNGSINAAGGYCGYNGSRGAIRIIAQRLIGSGSIDGEVTRLESCEGEFLGGSNASTRTFARPPNPVFVASLPTLKIVSVQGNAVPTVPSGSFLGSADVTLPSATSSAQVQLAATNIPPGTKADVVVIPKYAAPTTLLSSALAGTTSASTASVTVPLSPGETIIQVSAMVDISVGQAAGLVAGERVTAVRVGATYGGRSSLSYITASGREVAAPD